tara:strand:- start:73 stop:600 length:528 start_codon:yes stop_codon:yes gene_type:complete
MDILFAKMVAFGVSLIFLIGFIQKIKDLELFRSSVEAYDLIPISLVKYAAYTIILTEGTTAILLMLDRTLVIGCILAASLLSIVTLAIAINLLRGNTDIGCGCGGIEDEQLISWSLALRNVILIVIISPIFFQESWRNLTVLDNFTLILGGSSVYGLYVLSSQLITNQPRLRGLK